MQEINIVVHKPKTAKNQQELAKRVAIVHADSVIQKLRDFPCPAAQKKEIYSQIKKGLQQKKTGYSPNA